MGWGVILDPVGLVFQPASGQRRDDGARGEQGLVIEQLHPDAQEPVGQDLVVVLAVGGHQVRQHERQGRLAGLTGTDARRVLVAPGSVDGGPVQEEVDLVAGAAVLARPVRRAGWSPSSPPGQRRWTPPGTACSGAWRSPPRWPGRCSTDPPGRPRPQVVLQPAGWPGPDGAAAARRRRRRPAEAAGTDADLDAADGHRHLVGPGSGAVAGASGRRPGRHGPGGIGRSPARGSAGRSGKRPRAGPAAVGRLRSCGASRLGRLGHRGSRLAGRVGPPVRVLACRGTAAAGGAGPRAGGGSVGRR